VAGAQLQSHPSQPLRVQTVYDDTRGRFKVIVLGGLTATADLLQTITDILGTEIGMFPTDTDRSEARRD